MLAPTNYIGMFFLYELVYFIFVYLCLLVPIIHCTLCCWSDSIPCMHEVSAYLSLHDAHIYEQVCAKVSILTGLTCLKDEYTSCGLKKLVWRLILSYNNSTIHVNGAKYDERKGQLKWQKGSRRCWENKCSVIRGNKQEQSASSRMHSLSELKECVMS